MIVLGIDTSCDDTSAAIYDGKMVCSNVVSTQFIHKQFGGVVPELASRAHIQWILPVIREALKNAHVELHEIEGIAVTYGPGLAGSLLVGLSTAKGIALSLRVPLIGINHLEGHIWANAIENPELEPPFVTLIASGGHTQLVYVKSWGKYQVLGRTQDDAAGEAFDKVAKLLGLKFPGGPEIERMAEHGNPEAIFFPRAFLEPGSFDFSFSGLKTAVLNYVKKIGQERVHALLPDICASFQKAIVDVLVEKSIWAAEHTGVKTIAVGGGVAINKTLQNTLQNAGEAKGVTVFFPSPRFCGDNAAMISIAGHYRLSRGESSPLSLAVAPALNL